MADFHASGSAEVSTNDIGYWNGGPEQLENCDVHESENLGEYIVDELDSYMEDIDDRLTISRMVSDSIIKGMVNAVSQEATEVVMVKELEVVRLRKKLSCQQFGSNGIDSSSTLTEHDELGVREHGTKSLGVLNQDAKEQLERLGKCIADTKGIGGNLEERNGLYEVFCCFQATLKAMCQQVDVVAYSPECTAEQWKVELDIRKEVEAMVFCTILQGLQCEYEKQVWDVNNVLALIDGFKEISRLRHELESLRKCFVGSEVGHLSPQGSIEMDHFHRKVLSNHSLPSSQLWDGNGKCEESTISMPENFESSALKHMKTQELYQHFRTVITKMKREHESTVQQMTDKYFTLKRELFKERELVKERGPFVAYKNDKDFEILKKKISEVIPKLDDLVRENEKLSEFCNHARDKLDSLLSENCHLKDLLNGQKLELHHLSLQASDASKKVLHAGAEENLHKLVEDHKRVLQDDHIEASISEEVYKCIIREMAFTIYPGCNEDLDLKSIIMQDIFRTIYEEAFYAVDVANKSHYEEISYMQSFIIQQIYGAVFEEVLGDMSMKINEWKERSLKEDENLSFLEKKMSVIENQLAMKDQEIEELKNHLFVLENSIKEKDNLSLQLNVLREKDQAQFTEELNKLRCLTAHHEALSSDKNEELELLKNKLEDCGKQIQFHTSEVERLNKAVEMSEHKLRNANEVNEKLISDLELRQNDWASIKMKDIQHIKHMKSLCHAIQGLTKSFADFELRIKESIGWHNVRLENSAFQLHSLIPKANVLRRTGSLYKERLEKRCSDLCKAETEVDLLGDEVDALLSILEKIYVALDHYSPVLQHYPGIIEILKLVKRELRGEAVKSVV